VNLCFDGNRGIEEKEQNLEPLLGGEYDNIPPTHRHIKLWDLLGVQKTGCKKSYLS